MVQFKVLCVKDSAEAAIRMKSAPWANRVYDVLGYGGITFAAINRRCFAHIPAE